MEKVSLTKSSFDRLAEEWYDGESQFRWIEYHPPQEYWFTFYRENDDGGDVHHAGIYDLELEEFEISEDYYDDNHEFLEDMVNDIVKETA